MTARAPTPASELLERDLQRHVRAYAERFGWKVHVTWVSMHSPRGWPDLTLYRLRPDGVGEIVCVELKREHAKTTPEQDWWLEALRTVPGVKWAGVLRPSQWYAGELERLLA